MNANKFIDRMRLSRPSNLIDFPPPFVPDNAQPDQYIMDADLESAANTALALGQPLLLTGDPGTGKTQFAHHLAWQLGLDAPLEYHTKSNSVASDLFYTYDTVRRFHVAHTGIGESDERAYIRYNALGRSVLLSRTEAEIKDFCLPDVVRQLQGPRRSVVLVDEIDKAPRDFPNDLLHELAAMAFAVPELGCSISADQKYRPIVVITSNRERPLPDAFLRRCVFFHIEAPNHERLIAILAKRFGYDDAAPPALLVSAVKFYEISQFNVSRPASTSELVGWFSLLVGSGLDLGKGIAQAKDIVALSISALAKSGVDHAKLRELLFALT